ERASGAARDRARAQRGLRGQRERAAGFRRGPAAGRARARRRPRGERQRTTDAHAGARAGAHAGGRRSAREGLAGRGARGTGRGGRPRRGLRQRASRAHHQVRRAQGRERRWRHTRARGRRERFDRDRRRAARGADAGRRSGARALSFDRFIAAYDELVEKARTNTLTADELVGANITLTNPGGLGTVASVPRLMSGQGAIVATGSIAYPPGLAGVGADVGAEKV